RQNRNGGQRDARLPPERAPLRRRRGAVGRLGVTVSNESLPTRSRPGIEIGLERVDRAHLVVYMTMDGHAFALFPTPHRRHVAPHVGGDFLPRVEAVLRRTVDCG